MIFSKYVWFYFNSSFEQKPSIKVEHIYALICLVRNNSNLFRPQSRFFNTTAWKCPIKWPIFSGPNTGKYRPEKAPYLAISLLLLSEFNSINLFPLKWSEYLRFFDDFRRSENRLIYLNSLNIASEMRCWGNFLY